MTIVLTQVFGRPYFETRSEYLMSIALAMEGARRGILVDFTGMKTRCPLSSNVYAGYKNYLIENNLVLGATVLEDNAYPYESEDLSFLDNPKLFEDNEEYLYWNTEYAKDVLGSDYYRKTTALELEYLYIQLTAKHWMDYLLGIESRCLYLGLDKYQSQNASTYLDIESLRHSLRGFDQVIGITLDEGCRIDLKLSLFQYDAHYLGFNREYTLEEKLSQMAQYGFEEGMVLILFERKGINTSNSLGNIDAARLVRVDEIVEGKLYLSMLRATRTYEETAKDFEMIPENNRHLYLDLLDYSDSIYDNTVVELRECGVGNHFFRERYLIDSISTVDKVKKLIFNGKDIVEMELSEAEAIYYTLMQNNANIDAQKYRDYYFGGSKGYFDEVDSSVYTSPANFVSQDVMDSI